LDTTNSVVAVVEGGEGKVVAIASAVSAPRTHHTWDSWQAHSPDRSAESGHYRLSDEDSLRFMKKVPCGTGKPAADAGKSWPQERNLIFARMYFVTLAAALMFIIDTATVPVVAAAPGMDRNPFFLGNSSDFCCVAATYHRP
jgi:hypothetical protein